MTSSRNAPSRGLGSLILPRLVLTLGSATALVTLGCSATSQSGAGGASTGGNTPIGGAIGGNTGGTGAAGDSGGRAANGGRAGSPSGGTSGRAGAAGSGGRASNGGRAGSNGGSGGSATAQAGASTGGKAVPETCEGTTELPANAPTLKAGTWVDITPPGIPKGNPDTMIGQGLTMDPCNSAILYWGSTPYDEEPYSGLYRTTDAGATWTRLGNRSRGPNEEGTSTSYLDMPLHVRVDPRNPRHLYAADGVRGATLGFWVSNDAGETWTKPAGYTQLGESEGIFIDDVYDVAVNPTDFDHLLVSLHSEEVAGVLESKDGGKTWARHPAERTWGTGHAIHFLYEPTLGIGDANTWLLGTQGDGMWRTTDAGKTWKRVYPEGIFHGGGRIYYSKTGVLYAGSESDVIRSTDNGATWSGTDFGYGTIGIIGDGERLYSGPAYGFGEQPFFTAPEETGRNWQRLGSQAREDWGPFAMVYDKANRILYASTWFQGVWALKLAD